jgi:type IV secretion system protein TrbL
MNRSTIGDALASFVMMLLFTGFVLSVIRNYNDWSMQIIDGFLQMAGPPADKSPLEIGLNLVKTIWNNISIITPADSVGYVILGVIILISFAMMTAKMVFVQCEAYFLVGVSIILLGLGGLTHTKDYALNVMRYCLSVAFKLFVMQMLINLGMSMFQSLIAAQEGSLSWETLGVYIFAAIILLALTYSIPEAAAGVINGSHVGSGHALIASAATVGGAVYGAVKAANKAAVAGSRGLSSIQAATQIAQLDGLKGFGQVAKGAASNLWSAHQAARQGKNAMGGVDQRMNTHLKEGVTIRENQAKQQEE